MDRLNTAVVRIGAWTVHPALGQISRPGESVRLEARSLRLLVYLAERAGQVVSIEELLEEVWSGVVVTSDSVYQAVAGLRRTLGDDAREPRYIATVPRLGYRLVAAVNFADPPQMEGTLLAPVAPKRTGPVVAILVLLLALALSAALYLEWHLPQARSLAVLPFRDLTSEAMDKEYFADGMTEELIDQLSRIKDLKVAGPAESFYFKDRHVSVAQMAQSLGVSFVLDGSVRKSADTYTVAVRLIRASDGFVTLARSFDRPQDEELKAQREIAQALSIELDSALR
jgi:DNA-binding winged helix-turn-helix (wHTH) protein/TolB-like protein